MEIKEITLDDFIKIRSSGQKFKLVDVRDFVYYQKEHIENAISIPLKEFQAQAEKLLKKDETVVVYCVDVNCPLANKAAKILLSKEYKNVLYYKGGFLEYRAAGLPTKKQEMTIKQ